MNLVKYLKIDSFFSYWVFEHLKKSQERLLEKTFEKLNQNKYAKISQIFVHD